MSLEHQREAVRVLSELLDLSPEIRMGQLFAHLGFLGEAHLDRGLGYLDDDEMLALMYRHLAELRARQTGHADQLPNTTGEPMSVSGSPTVPDVSRAKVQSSALSSS